ECELRRINLALVHSHEAVCFGQMSHGSGIIQGIGDLTPRLACRRVLPDLPAGQRVDSLGEREVVVRSHGVILSFSCPDRAPPLPFRGYCRLDRNKSAVAM